MHEAVNRFGLQDFVRELRDEVTDEVELKLIEHALAGRPWAVQFWLRTIGRDRGYVERQEVAQVGKLEVELVEVAPGDDGG
ncbi:hypothetical protein [Thermus sp.]|uniref:hypothetical protein n=1 Tax=Thermus sp. TaxID=275 RepID=UPI002627608D|nr:hypothetical protein [Thermus sp.]MCX7850938.1 hypothetical protein [Thermus sp.]